MSNAFLTSLSDFRDVEQDRPVSVFDLPGVLESGSTDKIGDTPMPDTFVNVLVSHLIQITMSETGGVRRGDSIVKSYAKKMILRLQGEEDSGLLPAGAIDVWCSYNSAQKRDVVNELTDASEVLVRDMPRIDRISVMETGSKVTLGLGDRSISATIPALAKTERGMSGIIPVYNRSVRHNSVLVDVFGDNLSLDNGVSIIEYHIWDISAKKVSRMPEKSDEVESIKTILN